MDPPQLSLHYVYIIYHVWGLDEKLEVLDGSLCSNDDIMLDPNLETYLRLLLLDKNPVRIDAVDEECRHRWRVPFL